MNDLIIDIETFSSVDLAKCGVYKYAESDDFEILLFAYSVDYQPVQVIDLANGETIPYEILDALQNPNIIKHAFNAAFERVCLSYWCAKQGLLTLSDKGVPAFLGARGWQCDMIRCAYISLPMSLEKAGAILKVEQQKMKEGKDLIRYFCVPCKPTKTNRGRTRNLPSDNSEKWELFKAYNKRDVETEIAIERKISKVKIPDKLWKEYELDQKINDRGVLLDLDLVKAAILMDEQSKEKLLQEITSLTMLENPNSVVQLKGWLADKGYEVDSLGKKEVEKMLEDAPEEIAKVLSLRLQLAKSSIKKYQAMLNCACKDGRARGLFQFYGASRTGRWSGRLIQLQNLRRNDLPDLEEARELVKSGNYEAVEMLYDSVPDTLSQLVRTALIPQPGKKFIVADFSAIEARVLSWLAGETWRMETFAAGGDIYCATAGKMFHCKVEKHGENGELRQKGKQAELACGYGGSVGAMKAMGALEMGMKEEELKPLVDAWREANPKIVEFWWKVDEAVKKTIRTRKLVKMEKLGFRYEMGMLFISLPSGRDLVYIKPRIEENQFGGESITYMGVGLNKKWERLESYGPKFAENIVQAVARDLLMEAMLRMKGKRIVAHVHDEVIVESDIKMNQAINLIEEKMTKSREWYSGLLLNADGYECKFYKKD